MVVVVVIGLLVGIFTLSIGAFSTDDGREEMRRLQTLLQMASEEATMQGRDLGLQFYQSGYEFAARLPRTNKDGVQVWEWTPLDDDRLLRPRDLGENFRLELELEDKEITLPYERESIKDYEPQVFLLSSGDIEPPFGLRLGTLSGSGYRIEVDADGEIQVTDDEF